MPENPRLVELNLNWEPRTRPVPPPAETRATVRQRMAEVEPLKARVFAQIDAMRDEAIAFLQQLVRTPSVNPSPDFEKPIASLIAKYLREQGAEVRQIEPVPNRVSNWALFRGTTGEKTLLFDSHMDIVPTGDPAAWQYPPFGAEIHDGKLWGRGAKDMKFGMAAALLAPRMLKAAGIDLHGNLMITTTADEECGGQLGIHPMLQTGWVKANWCIYTEGNKQTITIGSKGWCQVEVIARGKNAHTGRKELGKNAILAICKVAPQLDALRYPGDVPHPILPGGTIASVNIIEGGFKENVVPDHCRLIMDVRFAAGPRPADILGEVEKVLQEAMAADPTLELECRPYNVARPSFVSPDEPLVHIIAATAEQLLGFAPKAEGMVATSDARYIWLDMGIPTANYSMGNETAHMPNEHIDLDDYINTIKLYCHVALQLLA